MTPLEKVRAEILRYEHALLEFSAREHNSGIELVISMKQRDIAHPQFPWTFQRYLYDCMHDYLVEMFIRTPQMKESGR